MEKRENYYKIHQKLLKDVMLAIQNKYNDAKIFERHVGSFRYLKSNGVIKINKKGMADLWMLYGGHHFEIEIKSGKAKQTKDQKKWEKIVNECGSHYLVMRSVDDIELLDEFISPRVIVKI